MTAGDRIKQRRIELGLTQDELAKKMGYSSKSAVSRTENSGDDIGVNRIKKFAEVLNTTPSYLMGWLDEKPFSRMSKTDDVLTAHAETGIPINKLIGVDYEITKEDCDGTTRIHEAMKASNTRLGLTAPSHASSPTKIDMSNANRVFINMCMDMLSDKIDKNMILSMNDDSPEGRKRARKEIIKLLNEDYQTAVLRFDESEYSKEELEKIKEYAEFLKSQRKQDLNAARPRTDVEVTEEMKQHDDAFFDED